MDLAFFQILGVHADHTDAMAVMPAQISFNHMISNDFGFVFVTSVGLQESVSNFIEQLF